MQANRRLPMPERPRIRPGAVARAAMRRSGPMPLMREGRVAGGARPPTPVPIICKARARLHETRRVRRLSAGNSMHSADSVPTSDRPSALSVAFRPGGSGGRDARRTAAMLSFEFRPVAEVRP
jgi:hypothetical protein